MGLSQCRPVELWTCTAIHGRDSGGVTNVMVRISAVPLRMSEACHAPCSIGFDRNLTHGYGRWLNGFNGGSGRCGYSEEGLRDMLKAEPNDLVIPPSFITDDQIISDPVGWVRGVLDRYIKRQEEGMTTALFQLMTALAQGSVLHAAGLLTAQGVMGVRPPSAGACTAVSL